MTIDLGRAKAIEAESFGEPGQRTFRLLLIGERADSGSLWMEKEQFQALTLALSQVLSELRHQAHPNDSPVYEFPEAADYDFKVGRMALSLDTSDGTVLLYLSDTESSEKDDPTLVVRVTQDQCSVLRGQLDEIITRGRPVCPLCHAPLDAGGHACIRGNGHSSEPIPEEDAGGEDEG